VRRTIVYRELDAQWLSRFVDLGYPKTHIFPHKIFAIPKPGPDAERLAKWMLGDQRGLTHWTLLLHATGEDLLSFPGELFFDKDLVIHQQHFGEVGHVAFAYVISAGKNLYVLQLVSDPVQRRTRAPQFQERLKRCFRGWRYMLVNSVLDFAFSQGKEQIHFATAELVKRHSDTRRAPSGTFLKRIYDDTISQHFDATRQGDWWLLDSRTNRERVVPLAKKVEARDGTKKICITHDIERGIGHRIVDPHFAQKAERYGSEHLGKMLAVEHALDCRTTYCVVGSILAEVRAEIEHQGHCLGFHSYDHAFEPKPLWQKLRLRYLRVRFLSRIGKYPPAVQLKLCREIDYMIRGYRPPNSIITPELCVENLRCFNFDWFASSSDSLGTKEPCFRDGVVFLPIAFDDFSLYSGDRSYADWEAKALSIIERRNFTALGLHDCYGDHWLPHYRSFLERVMDMGELNTLDDIANEIILEQCR
jgi:hypothetical protein